MEESGFADLILIFYTFMFYVLCFMFYVLVLMKIINYCMVNRRHF